MDQNKITEIDVDDYIREKKRSRWNYILWGKHGRKIFRKFARAVYSFEGYRFPHSFPNGHHFMGIKHFTETTCDTVPFTVSASNIDDVIRSIKQKLGKIKK